MTFGEVLGRFKNKESVETCVALMDDNTLRNGFLAWTSVRIRYKTPAESCNETEVLAQWDWMWSQIEYERRRFGIVAGVNGQDVEDTITRLIGLKLIYPDGSQNELALLYIRQEVKKRLGLKKTKKDKK